MSVMICCVLRDGQCGVRSMYVCWQDGKGCRIGRCVATAQRVIIHLDLLMHSGRRCEAGGRWLLRWIYFFVFNGGRRDRPENFWSANARSRGLHNPSPTSRTPLPLGHERERGCNDLNYYNGIFVYPLQSDLKFKLSQMGNHVPRTSSDVNTWSYLPHI